MTPKKSPTEELFQYEPELPEALDLANIAAILGPNDRPLDAVKNAVKLYLKAVEFHNQYQKATPIERAKLCGEHELATRAGLYIEALKFGIEIQKPKSFPATHDDFLKLVVNAKTPADSEKRLRDFFRNQCPHENDQETFAVEQIRKLKGGGLDEEQWFKLGHAYLNDRKIHVQAVNQKNARRPRKKQP